MDRRLAVCTVAGVTDVTELILADHAWFRLQFAALDAQQATTPVDVPALRQLWEPLGARLDLHAAAEERIFYPQLLKMGEENPAAETLDAIGDHNDIRDGVHDADRHPVGSAEWWAAVTRARVANDEHMAEEEHEGISDFRLHAPSGLREALGRQFADFLDLHRTTVGVDVSDKDPQGYVDAVEADLHETEPEQPGGDTSLGIGSLKGR